MDPRAVRGWRARAFCRRRAVLVRQESLRRRPRALIPHIEGAQRRVPALANCGIKDIVNGPISYTPDGSALIGPAWGTAELLAQRGPQLRHYRGRRRRVAARGMDCRGRAGHRPARCRPAAFRCLREQALRGDEERGNVPQRLHRALPGRGAPGCAPGKDEPGVREAETDGCGVRPALRLGARQLVRARRRRGEGRLELPPHQLVRARRCGVQADSGTGGRHRPHAVHQARGARAGRRVLARFAGRQQGAGEGRAHGAFARAHPARRHPLRVHDHEARRRVLLSRQRRCGRALRQ